LRTLQAPGATIARGRNLAIESTTASVIAVTDAGVRLDPDWLATMLARLQDSIDVVGGFFLPEAHTTFERALAAAVLPALHDVRAETFLPSSRSVLFRRAAWQRIGGYPEWLDYCEDLVFDLRLRSAGLRFEFAPEAVVWFRPRRSVRAFFRQYFLYARGDGKADLWRKRHAVRFATYAIALMLLARGGRLAWPLLLMGGLAYTRRPYARLWPMLAGRPPGQVVAAIGLVPVIRAVGDIAKMLGYPSGVWWRLRRCRSSS
jgi:GT2 family glycosyltransferase